MWWARCPVVAQSACLVEGSNQRQHHYHYLRLCRHLDNDHATNSNGTNDHDDLPFIIEEKLNGYERPK